ncbi:TetR/AcrR family transcriptional regulator [Agreia pratensis]|nr:TetR/AcrR family transcriptional regulator [Agreia pratensis]
MILDTAVALFLTAGFAATSIDEVARRSEASKSTVYAYFGDKAGLFSAAVERLHDAIAESIDGEATLAELATSVVMTLHSDEAVGLHRTVIAESLRFPELARSFYASGPSRSTQMLLAALRRADPAITAVHAEMLYTLLLGESHRRRLLGLSGAPSVREAAQHARDALHALGHR